MPETKVDRHKVIPKLPLRPSTVGDTNLSEEDGTADKKAVLSDGEANESVTSASKQKRESHESSSASSISFIADLPTAVPVKTPGKRGRKRKDPEVKKKESESVSERADEDVTAANEEKAGGEEEERIDQANRPRTSNHQTPERIP